MDKSEVAILISVVSFLWTVGWSIYLWWDQRRKHDQRVRVGVRVDDKQGRPFLAVDIYNCGLVQAYLKSVKILWRRPIDHHQDLPLETDVLELPTSKGEAVFIRTTRSLSRKMPLEPHASCDFYLFDADLDLMRKLVGMPTDEVWLSVESNGGELCRINGRVLMPEVIGLTHLWEDAAARQAPAAV